MNMEANNKLMELYISNLKKAVELIDSVFIPVIKDFDGKVINRRLDNRLEEVLKADDRKNQYYFNTHIDVQKCMITVNFYNQREIYCMEKYWNTEELHRQVYYLPHGLDEVNICWKYSDYNSYDSSKNEQYHKKTEGNYFYIDSNCNTRLLSAGIVNCMLERKKDLLNQIEELEYAITLHAGFTENQVEAWIEETEKMHKRAEELYRAIPSPVKGIYKIKCYATWQ